MSIYNNHARIFDEIPDSFQAYLVNDAKFTKIEEYPIITREMVSKTIPQKILPFEKAINSCNDLSKTFICFYSPDATFERIRKNPKNYVSFFRRTAGIIGFDFSIHSNMPIIKQKSQMNDNLSLTYYYGSQGIPVIPNLRCGVNELLPEFLSAIPQNTIVAIGTHGFYKRTREQCEWYCFLEKVIESIQPSNIVVYGPLSSKMFENFKENTSFELYASWISNRQKEVIRNGN